MFSGSSCKISPHALRLRSSTGPEGYNSVGDTLGGVGVNGEGHEVIIGCALNNDPSFALTSTSVSSYDFSFGVHCEDNDVLVVFSSVSVSPSVSCVPWTDAIVSRDLSVPKFILRRIVYMNSCLAVSWRINDCNGIPREV